MSLLVLTQPRFLAIANAAAALCPTDRDPFIAAVAAELRRQSVIGDGTIGRVIAAVQGNFDHPKPDTLAPRWAREPRRRRA
jgi:hypothetical protein